MNPPDVVAQPPAEPAQADGRLSSSMMVVMGRSMAVGARLAALLVVALSSSPSVLGAYALALAVADVVRVVADCGIDVFSLREYGRDPASLLANAQRVFVTKLVAGAAASLLCVVATLTFAAPERHLALLPVALLPATQLLITFFLQLELARGGLRRVVTRMGAMYAAGFAVLVLCYLTGAGTGYAFWIVFACEFAAAGLLWFSERVALSSAEVWARFAGGDVPRLMVAAFPIGVAAILGMACYRLDLFIVSTALSRNDVGLYGFASRLVDPLNMVGGSWIATLGARFARRWQEDRALYRGHALRLLAYALATGIAFWLTLCFVGFVLVPRWFPAYALAAWLVSLLGAVLITRQLNYALTTLIISAGGDRAMPWLALAAIAACAVFVYAGAHAGGARGAALGLLAADAFGAATQYGYWRRQSAAPARAGAAA